MELLRLEGEMAEIQARQHPVSAAAVSGPSGQLCKAGSLFVLCAEVIRIFDKA